ncbi:MAG: hypothetical protein OES46_21155, partial [Gammaproteobacteria bacterium]|nr:hypothetical protein [Gammaproteobacteria bacterium]
NPWASHDKINYCNWFRLSSKDTYVIQVSIRRPGTQVRTAEFTARRFAQLTRCRPPLANLIHLADAPARL